MTTLRSTRQAVTQLLGEWEQRRRGSAPCPSWSNFLYPVSIFRNRFNVRPLLMSMGERVETEIVLPPNESDDSGMAILGRITKSENCRSACAS
jgi:hypothetical protein